MPTVKPTKPSITLPSAFGTSVSNVKTPFTDQELIDGYSASISQVLDGGNVNWLNDALFKYLTYTITLCDWLNNAGVGKSPFINSSNQLDYVSPASIDEANNFTGTNTFLSDKIKIVHPSETYNENPTSNVYNQLYFTDKDGNITGAVNRSHETNGTLRTSLICNDKNNTKNVYFGIGFNSNDNEEVNASTNIKKSITNWSMPSGTYENVTLKASGSDYTAPGNGYFVFRKQSNASGQYMIFSTQNRLFYQVYTPSSGVYLGGFCPAEKGSMVNIQYTLGGSTDFLRFVYAVGG